MGLSPLLPFNSTPLILKMEEQKEETIGREMRIRGVDGHTCIETANIKIANNLEELDGKV